MAILGTMSPEKRLGCPYCGENITILVDESIHDQAYVEDCEVCCRPISLHVIVNEDGSATIDARTDNE